MNDATIATLFPSGHTDSFARANLPPAHTWPEFLFDLPELHYPPRLNCVADLLDGAVKRGWGGRTALIGARERLTYAALLERVDRIAHVLRHDLGLATGNRVLVRGANCPTMAACILGVIKAGCIAVPTMPLLRARELGAIAGKARVNAMLCAGTLVDEVAALGLSVPVLVFDAPVPDCLEQRMARHGEPFVAADTAQDDVCLISFTSGTTGVPKGTMHFHRDVLAICDCFPRHALRAQADDVFVGTPPLAFTFGLGGLLLFPLRVGAAGVLVEKLTPEALLGAIAEHRATVCFTAPTFYRQMAAQAGRFDLSSLRASVSAGEALPVATREAWQAATGLAMIDGIGATELLHIFIASAGDDVRPGATGKPVPGYQACILDAQGRQLGPGVIGRLAVKGPTGCRYLADERQRDYVQDGWNLTGDAYEMDDDGYFYYRSRTDDMIISAGYNIAGAEVEEALLHHPAVAECAVVGRSDPERGQVVEAHVVLRSSHVGTERLAHELQEFVKGQIAPYKYPRAILFKEQLPRTETGKLQRFKLRTEAV
ncbi:AMP-binding protein [Massilia timonae]|uniref:Benzoate-CoA ligase n=1 Tax=Massilia timonae CCUG 45783 TaxID=883126 RepID=K9DTL6_9BURK|nr:AMP-binding protein [Massilia timonae]EKU80695.1 benzoate-CoA ligase [Massilia timonae CCUG 45783]